MKSRPFVQNCNYYLWSEQLTSNLVKQKATNFFESNFSLVEQRRKVSLDFFFFSVEELSVHNNEMHFCHSNQNAHFSQGWFRSPNPDHRIFKKKRYAKPKYFYSACAGSQLLTFEQHSLDKESQLRLQRAKAVALEGPPHAPPHAKVVYLECIKSA